MAVGMPSTKPEVDSAAGATARAVLNVIDNVDKMNAFLARTGDTALTTMGYTSSDIAALRTAYADLAALSAIFKGATAVTVAKDFRTNLWPITGVLY